MSDIFSMTGYGKGVAEQDGRKATVELKSVNHRFLDLGLKLPKSLMFAEDGLRKAIQKSISRGHIDLFISFDDDREKQQNACQVRACGERTARQVSYPKQLLRKRSHAYARRHHKRD